MPAAAVFYYSRDRGGEPSCRLHRHPTGRRLWQLRQSSTKPGPITEAPCWVHYLESDFIWSRRPRRQLSPMTSRRKTLHNSGRRVDIHGHDGDCRCRSRCIRRRAPNRTSRTMSGVPPDCRVVRCTRRADARLPGMAVTRNCRRAALRSFFKHLLRNDLARSLQYTRVLAIPSKKARQSPATYLEADDMRAIIAKPDRRTDNGWRDYALLLFLYNCGARVSEAIGVRWDDLYQVPLIRTHGPIGAVRLT